MKRILMQYAERIDAASLRERVGIFTAMLFVMLFIVDSAILAPLLDKERKLTRENAQRQAEALVIQQQVKALVRARDDNPDERNRRVLADLKLESGRLESSILEQSRRFTPPERMRSVLQEMLERNSKLQLIEFKTLAVAPLAESGGDKARAPERRIFRHGVELTLSGSYLDLHAYLTALEKLPTQLYWGKADLGASSYPTATLKLTVFTLSLDPAWMVV